MPHRTVIAYLAAAALPVLAGSAAYAISEASADESSGGGRSGGGQSGGGQSGGGATVVGFAMWFRTFSTWLGTGGIHLEDLYVRPTARRTGLGRALLAELARIAVERGYGRLEWSVLDWNEPAQNFYTSLAARPMEEWTTWRLEGPALPALGRTHSHR